MAHYICKGRKGGRKACLCFHLLLRAFTCSSTSSTSTTTVQPQSPFMRGREEEKDRFLWRDKNCAMKEEGAKRKDFQCCEHDKFTRDMFEDMFWHQVEHVIGLTYSTLMPH